MILAIPLPSFAEEVPGKALLDYFYGSCQTSTQWVQAALADSEALIKSLNAMSGDPDCASASGAISQLNSLSSQLTTLNKLNDTKNTVATYNAEEQQLLIQLSQTTDTDSLIAINTNLRELQVSRAKLLNGDKSAEKLSGTDKVTLMVQIANSANASFQQISANQKCINNHSGLLKSATSIMAGVGSAVTMVNPALGLAMTAGAVFANVSMDGIRGFNANRKIRSIADNTTSFEAYKCALESMSDRWCQMKDAESFLKFKQKHRKSDLKNPGLAQAMSLNDREIPVILNWLNNLRNGVTPRNTADARRQNEVLDREALVRKNAASGIGLIEQKRQTYDSLSAKPDEQWQFLRTIIKSLAPQMSNSSPYSESVRNPLNDIFSSQYSPYYLLGIQENDARIRDKDNGTFLDFESWTKPSDVKVSLDSVKVNYLDWIKRASDLVNRELAEVQQPDPLQTLSSVNIEAEPWMVTPLEAFKTIADFLEKNPSGEKQGDFKKIYKDTLEKLKNIHDIATVAIATGDVAPRSLDPSKLTPVEQIYDIAQLKYGIVVLQTRLEMIVRLSLLEYIKNSPEEDQILVAQLLASDRFYETINKINPTSNTALLKADIRTGQAYTMKNIASFMNIFGPNINRTLRTLYKGELRTKDPTEAKSNHDLRTTMCFLVLGAVNVKDKIDVELCTGLKIEAAKDGGPESITITDSTFGQDLSERACTYREYFRQSAIYDRWGIKN